MQGRGRKPTFIRNYSHSRGMKVPTTLAECMEEVMRYVHVITTTIYEDNTKLEGYRVECTSSTVIDPCTHADLAVLEACTRLGCPYGDGALNTMIVDELAAEMRKSSLRAPPAFQDESDGIVERFKNPINPADWYISIPNNDKHAANIVDAFLPYAKKGVIVEVSLKSIDVEDRAKLSQVYQDNQVDCIIESVRVPRSSDIKKGTRMWLVWIKNDEDLVKKLPYHSVLL